MNFCPNHPERKAHAKGLCASCYNRFNLLSDNDRYERSLAQRRETLKKRRSMPDFPALQKNRTLKHRYGITLDDFERMKLEQNGLCFICGKEGGTTKNTALYVDHCHKKNVPRKLLCQKCNFALGILEQGEEFVSKLYAYLDLHK